MLLCAVKSLLRALALAHVLSVRTSRRRGSGAKRTLIAQNSRSYAVFVPI